MKKVAVLEAFRAGSLAALIFMFYSFISSGNQNLAAHREKPTKYQKTTDPDKGYRVNKDSMRNSWLLKLFLHHHYFMNLLFQ